MTSAEFDLSMFFSSILVKNRQFDLYTTSTYSLENTVVLTMNDCSLLISAAILVPFIKLVQVFTANSAIQFKVIMYYWKYYQISLSTNLCYFHGGFWISWKPVYMKFWLWIWWKPYYLKAGIKLYWCHFFSFRLKKTSLLCP